MLRTASLLVFVSCISVPLVASADSKADAIKVVHEAQRAGFERHDLAGYLAMWTDDATIIGTRPAAKKGAYDMVQTRAQFGATKKLMFTGRSTLFLSFSEVKAQATPWGIRIEAVATITAPGAFIEKVQETYLMRRTAAGWRCYQNTWALLATGPADKPVTTDAAYYARLDAAVDAAGIAKDTQRLVDALMQAGRLDEARTAVEHGCKEQPDSAKMWAKRVMVSYRRGDVPDALASAAKARALDGSIWLPPWAAK
ncbi:MAG: ketosteroid isomerase-like protein [Myxococcota bacterium]|jgi:ketosteroid isomerase-like protein